MRRMVGVMKSTHFYRGLGVCLALGILVSASGWAATPYATSDRPDKSWNIFTRARREQPSEELASARQRREAGRLISAGRRYRAVYNQWPVSREAADALQEYAEVLEERSRKRRAFDTYQQLIEEHPGRFAYDEILERQFDIAVHLMNRRKARIFFGGFRDPEDAVPYLEKIVANAPASDLAPRAQFLIAEAYEQGRSMDKAIPAYLTFELRYPEHELAAEAAYRRCLALHRMARRSPNNTLLLEEAWSAMSAYLIVHGDAEHRDEIARRRDETQARRARVAFEQAAFYDRSTARPEATLTAYQSFLQRFPDSDWSAQVYQRIQELERKLSHETDPS